MSTSIQERLRFEAAHATDESAIRKLVEACGLPTSDLTAAHLAQFFVCRTPDGVVGSVGLELAGESALLRSLAVEQSHRGLGIASELVRVAETHAATSGGTAVYLLTTTAEKFFAARGYQTIRRDAAPPAMQATLEFAAVCPSASVCMAKRLAG